MFQSKQDYLLYMEADRFQLKAPKKASFKVRLAKLFVGLYTVQDYLRLLRKVEYYQNCKKSFISRVYTQYLRAKLSKNGTRLGFFIAPNCIGPGFCIPHPGTIWISGKAKIGSNCRINACVVIGQQNGKAPVIGNNVFIGSGAKIIGGITIADGIAIGANAFVNKSFLEPNITIGGIPAKKISNTGSQNLILDATGLALKSLMR